ncbi:Crp/Fnr family transcriptional regulator [Flavobacterium cucumis]|uniref:cAMP-binding domain of CRP or a regulatory subunit of cAMP-dependent protein kinases n=1 Tax=Flavobacterium cucumis TaxID=416016 RepID=A0A1M8A0B8_9FLAO|nr:Crp/Fnr family transcriptional regulator [Flavobacterium cucumis]SHO74307.1 cAMP-binding domain of CRP or a regulatory subunit of cAMP-dependent protein kinases [Flavobacterium cucumis]
MSKCEQCIVRQFSSLKALNKDELLRMAECKTSYTIKKGEPIFEEGEVTNGIYCIKDGVCKLSKLSDNGKDQIVKLVKPGELLGQRSMISDEPANLSAVALEDMEVCFIPRSEVMQFFTQNNQFSMNVMKTICEDLKGADDHMVNMAQKTVRQRLAETLIYLEDTFGKNDDGTLRIQLSREELAGMIGTATESCIRLLSELNKSTYIELIGKKIKLLDKNKLKRLT